jgi:hypothetical protein
MLCVVIRRGRPGLLSASYWQAANAVTCPLRTFGSEDFSKISGVLLQDLFKDLQEAGIQFLIELLKPVPYKAAVEFGILEGNRLGVGQIPRPSGNDFLDNQVFFPK